MALGNISSIVNDNAEYLLAFSAEILSVLFCVSNPLSEKVHGGQSETVG